MKLKNALGFISEKHKSPSVCESCGDEFVCGATLKGCWCMSVKLSDEARKNLNQKYKNCLCEKCLKENSSIEN